MVEMGKASFIYSMTFYLERLQQQVRKLGIELLEDCIPGGTLGMSEGGRITIRPDLPPANMTSTLVHEFAHERLHRGIRRADTDKLNRETEAEAVAFALCQRTGIEPNTASSDYTRLYGGTKEGLQQSLEHIRFCTAEILKMILPHPATVTPTQPPKKQQWLF